MQDYTIPLTEDTTLVARATLGNIPIEKVNKKVINEYVRERVDPRNKQYMRGSDYAINIRHPQDAENLS